MASASQGSFPSVIKRLGKFQLDTKARSMHFSKCRKFSELLVNYLQSGLETTPVTLRLFSSCVQPCFRAGSPLTPVILISKYTNFVCSSQHAGDIHILSKSKNKNFPWPFPCSTTFHQSRHVSGRATMNSPTRYYDVLGLSPNATQHQIKSAYYNMSKLYHPDVAKGSKGHKTFTEITEAYEVLGNIKKRRMYDRGIYTVRNTVHSAEDDADYTVAYQQKARNSPFERGDRPPPPRGRTNIYNFDEFYRQHYNEIRERRAQEYKEFIQHQQNMRRSGQGGGEGGHHARHNYEQFVMVLVALIVLGTLAISLETYDRDLIGSNRSGHSHPNYYGLRDPLRSIPVDPSEEKVQGTR